MDIKKTCYLFLDFDGTVLVHGSIPEENRNAIGEVQKLGHQVILNTGRSRGELDFSRECHQGVDWDGFIFGSSDLEYRGKRVFDHYMSNETVYAWLRDAMEKRGWINLEAEKNYCRISFEDHSQAYTDEEIDRIKEDLLRFTKGNRVSKMTVQKVDDNAEDLWESIHFTRIGPYAELLPDRRNKGIGFIDFCKEFRIPQEQCICFGDSLNDIDVFEVCPVSVCMAHSPDALKEKATYCAEGEFGVAEGIRKLFGMGS